MNEKGRRGRGRVFAEWRKNNFKIVAELISNCWFIEDVSRIWGNYGVVSS
jgi:hypothetical protein